MERHKTLGDYHKLGPKLRVGGDVDSWCTRCRMVLSHTVMAMRGGEVIKVQCNTCGSQHRYRAEAPGQGGKRAPRRKASGTWAPAPPKRAPKIWQEAIAGKDLSNPVPYHPKSTYTVGQVLMHGRFGTGVVMGVKEGGKIVVVFEDDMRVLVHDRG
mgnify:CR=1 FL=1